MQVNDIVKMLIFERVGERVKIIIQCMDFMDIRVCRKYLLKLFFHDKMNFGITELFFKTADYRSGEDNIPDGTEPYKKKFNHSDQDTERIMILRFIFQDKQCKRSIVFQGIDE